MDVNEVLDRARDSITVKRVYGEPIHQGEVIVIPAARIGGGGGGGSGQGPNAQGTGAGTGFGIGAKPAGAFIISKGRVRWRPAVDVNRVILGGQLVLAAALLTLGRIVRARNLRRLLIAGAAGRPLRGRRLARRRMARLLKKAPRRGLFALA